MTPSMRLEPAILHSKQVMHLKAAHRDFVFRHLPHPGTVAECENSKGTLRWSPLSRDLE